MNILRTLFARTAIALCWVVVGLNLASLYPNPGYEAAWWKVILAGFIGGLMSAAFFPAKTRTAGFSLLEGKDA